MESSTPRSGGRAAQRRRTRKAIVDAAMRLLAAGGTPTADEIAAEADVSRRTVFLHFPTLDQLLLDAALGATAAIPLSTAATSSDDVFERVDALVDAMVRHGRKTLPQGRRIIALTVSAPQTGQPKRGYRRVEVIEEALAPIRDRLEPEAFEQLVSALAVVVGWESMIVLEDIRSSKPRDELAVTKWAARALVAAALNEQ